MEVGSAICSFSLDCGGRALRKMAWRSNASSFDPTERIYREAKTNFEQEIELGAVLGKYDQKLCLWNGESGIECESICFNAPFSSCTAQYGGGDVTAR